MPQKQLYLIGGGHNQDPRMKVHHLNIRDLAQQASGPEVPRIALLPTAHHNGLFPEKLPHRDFIHQRFIDLGCEVEEIIIGTPRHQETTHTPEQVSQIIDHSHVIFVLNGDTRYLLQQCLDQNLNQVFINAYQNGKILAGSSAGCIWVGESCMSDSLAYDRPDNWHYISLQGLGIIPAILNAHDNQGVRPGLNPPVPRSQHFDQLLSNSDHSQEGIAIPEFTALHLTDDQVHIITTEPGLTVERVTVHDNTVTRTPIEEGEQLLTH